MLHVVRILAGIMGTALLGLIGLVVWLAFQTLITYPLQMLGVVGFVLVLGRLIVPSIAPSDKS